ncbi:MAG: hypothetical protein KIT44_06545 [Opitutaceae bacterium]|nr:hypothetical protein [Opitutaceae bacterium]
MSNTRTVTVHRADHGPDEAPVQPCTIVIGKTLGEDGQPNLPLHQMVMGFKVEADIIADALFDHLPQGVSYRVMLRLMERNLQRHNSPRRA